jgi:cell division protein FtsB
MKFKLDIIRVAIASLALIAMACFISKNSTLRKQLEYSKINELAYQRENSGLKEKAIQFEYTISDLNSSKDSLVKEMVKMKKQLKVKDSQLASLSYIKSMVQISDTITIRDTVFKNNTKIDTTVNNKWYNIGLHLEYPHMVGLNVSVPSEKYIVSTYNKVLLNPSKCKIKNWFKKKTKIVEVEVVEKNPYIVSEKQKFIEIVK